CEADKWRLFTYDRGSKQISQSASTLDYSVGSFAWRNSRDIAFVAEASGQTLICGTSVGLEWWIVGDAPHADDLVLGASDIPYFTMQSIAEPNEIAALVEGATKSLTQ